MQPNNLLATFNRHSLSHMPALVFLFMLSLSLTGCGDNSSKTPDQIIPKLTDTNIGAFTKKITTDYYVHSGNLLRSFAKAQKSGDINYFIDYRNQTWTPAYISHKDYYTKVFNENKAYLEASSAGPLFGQFENLIYIGLNLKNGLLNDDKEKIEQALTEAENDKKRVSMILKSTKSKIDPHRSN